MIEAQTPAPDANVAVLDAGMTQLVLLVAAAVILATGVLVIASGRGRPRDAGNMSIIRSWLAVTLVAGLVLFCAASLAIPDSSMRSTLFGGLIASAGAATAFYFASSNSDQARKDILDASVGTTQVPDLQHKTVEAAHAVMAQTALELRVDTPNAAMNSTVEKQDPPPGTQVRRGTTLVVTTSEPGRDRSSLGNSPPKPDPAGEVLGTASSSTPRGGPDTAAPAPAVPETERRSP